MKRRRALLLSITLMLALCAACDFWLHRARRQYAINRQLIDKLMKGDTKTARLLINAGADPNTRYDPPPAPSLTLLLDQLLHHTALDNDSATAFYLACSAQLAAVNAPMFL